MLTEKIKEKWKTLQNLLGKIDAQAEKGFFVFGEELKDIPRLEVLSSGAKEIDEATGIGGYPKGRMIEIFGPEGSGKTTLALRAIRACQNQGGIAAYLDAERTLDLRYAQTIGVSVPSLLLAYPPSAEEAFRWIEALCKSKAVEMIVVDSVAALIPQAEIEPQNKATETGLQALVISQSLRRIVRVIHETPVTLVFLNQTRYRFDPLSGGEETTPGGKALKFYSSLRLQIQPQAFGRQTPEDTGKIKVKIVKNKMHSELKDADLALHAS